MNVKMQGVPRYAETFVSKKIQDFGLNDFILGDKQQQQQQQQQQQTETL